MGPSCLFCVWVRCLGMDDTLTCSPFWKCDKDRGYVCVCVRWGGRAIIHKIKHFIKYLPIFVCSVRGAPGDLLVFFFRLKISVDGGYRLTSLVWKTGDHFQNWVLAARKVTKVPNSISKTVLNFLLFPTISVPDHHCLFSAPLDYFTYFCSNLYYFLPSPNFGLRLSFFQFHEVYNFRLFIWDLSFFLIETL